MDINGNGVYFYYWINLWYSSLDLIKVYLEEVQEEKTLNPGFALHPKLKFKSTSNNNIRYKSEENKNEPKDKVKQEFIELQIQDVQLIRRKK